jgi:integrase
MQLAVPQEPARRGLLVRNISELVSPPRPDRQPMTTLTADEASALLVAADDDRLRALYVLALTTGMRKGELLGLRWRDVDLDGGSLRVQGRFSRCPERG